MTITRYHAIAGLVVFVLLIAVFLIPGEYAGIGDMNNSTNETPEIEQMPLMSSPDDTDDRPGWWKSKGRSTVTTHNRSSDSSSGEDNNGSGSGGNEIPEFPYIILPMILILCISIIYNRK